MMEKYDNPEKNFTVDGWIIALIVLTIGVMVVLLQKKPELTDMVPHAEQKSESLEKAVVIDSGVVSAPAKNQTKKPKENAAKAPQKTLPAPAPASPPLSAEKKAKLRAIITGDL